ncbi:MAG TPA: hypothetical protein VF905_05430, partial [Nitrospirota bacterium]
PAIIRGITPVTTPPPFVFHGNSVQRKLQYKGQKSRERTSNKSICYENMPIRELHGVMGLIDML